MNITYPKIRSMSPQLLVSDLERSLNFYTGELGFEIDFRYEYFYAGIIKDGHSVHFKLGNHTTEERANKLKNEHLDLVFSVENISDLFDAIKSRGAIIIQPLREMPYGLEFYIADPDGYILGFMQTN